MISPLVSRLVLVHSLCLKTRDKYSDYLEIAMLGCVSKPAVCEIVWVCSVSIWRQPALGNYLSFTETVIFDCHYEKRWFCYWYCVDLSTVACEGNTCTLGESHKLEQCQGSNAKTIWCWCCQVSWHPWYQSVASVFPNPLPLTIAGKSLSACKGLGAGGRQPFFKPPPAILPLQRSGAEVWRSQWEL